jgi:hypothetical protein
VVGNSPVVLLQLHERKEKVRHEPIWKKTCAGAKLTEEGNGSEAPFEFATRGGGTLTSGGGHKVEGSTKSPTAPFTAAWRLRKGGGPSYWWPTEDGWTSSVTSQNFHFGM